MNLYSVGKKRLLVFLLLNLFVLVGYAGSIYGYVEKVALNPGQYVAKAKLDTGAVSASVNAVNIKIFKKQNKDWVQFEIPNDPQNIVLTRPLERHVLIKARRGEKKMGKKRKYFSRPVVKMMLTIGNKTKEIEVNLANRKRFLYPILLGRNALNKFDIIVDPSKAFLSDIELAPSRNK